MARYKYNIFILKGQGKMQTHIHTLKIETTILIKQENPEKLANASYKIKCETN